MFKTKVTKWNTISDHRACHSDHGRKPALCSFVINQPDRNDRVV